MDAMESIWEKVSHTDAKGEKIIIYQGVQDLVYLYDMGFVDGSKWTLEKWVLAFEESKRGDGSYRLTHAQWMAKKRFRYDPEYARSPAKNLAESYERLRTMTATAKALPAHPATTTQRGVSTDILRSARRGVTSVRV